jgi:hypothetical protein
MGDILESFMWLSMDKISEIIVTFSSLIISFLFLNNYLFHLGSTSLCIIRDDFFFLLCSHMIINNFIIIYVNLNFNFN